MNLSGSFQLKFDKALCRLLGFSSPWYAATKRTAVYNCYTFVLYSLPIIMAGFEIFIRFRFANIKSKLLNTSFVSSVAEVYFNVYFYHLSAERVNNFIECYNKNRKRLKNIFKTVSVKHYSDTSKISVIIIMTLAHAIVIGLRVMSLSTTNVYYSVPNILRYCFALALSVQWAIYMHRLQSDLSAVGNMLKTAFNRFSSMPPPPHPLEYDEVASIRFDDFEAAVHAYRIVADDYRLADDYYGAHIAFDICHSAFQAIKNPYLIWYNYRTATFLYDGSCWRCLLVAVKTLCDFVIIGIKAATSEYVTRKVSFR